MSFTDRFINYVRNENLLHKKDRLLLAVSGGVDSVVLCELCSRAGFYFEIAHANFQLRADESHRDENFVKNLGEKYSVKVWVKRFETLRYAEEKKLGVQEAARALRYNWFEEICLARDVPPARAGAEMNFNHDKIYLATAHHASDSVETLLMNFFKGTGIKGLLGIQSRPDGMRWIIRPLLFAKKEEIVHFAQENNLSFVADSSNTSDKYTRNYFRNHLIPSIQNAFPAVEENLLNNIERFKETEILYRQAINNHKKKLLEYHGNEVHIPVLKLLKAEPLKTVVYEIIKDYGFTAHQTEEVLHLLKSESGKFIASGTHKIIKNRKWIIIAPHHSRGVSLLVINEKDKDVEFEAGKLKIKNCNKADCQLPAGSNTAILDADHIKFPLLLRKWRQGDYFYPLGMHAAGTGRAGKKKLSRFFIDQKMSFTQKETAWVIESDKRIAWIVGKRIDDRFKITTGTENTIVIEFSEW